VAHQSVAAYLAALPPDQRQALERLRGQVARLIPEAEEAISYGIPTFKLNGRPVVWFAAWKGHCSIYPLTDAFLQANQEELKAYRRTKGSLHFTPQQPLPEGLVERLVRERLEEMAGSPATPSR
jgi:uncharacterized protein YdhG (YjbR/CyaY superfamily)